MLCVAKNRATRTAMFVWGLAEHNRRPFCYFLVSFLPFFFRSLTHTKKKTKFFFLNWNCDLGKLGNAVNAVKTGQSQSDRPMLAVDWSTLQGHGNTCSRPFFLFYDVEKLEMKRIDRRRKCRSGAALFLDRDETGPASWNSFLERFSGIDAHATKKHVPAQLISSVFH